MQERAAEAEANEALVNFEREKNKLFYDPEKGYFNSRGRNAYDQAQTITSELEKLRNTYSSNLSSGFARKEFDRASQTHLTRANESVMRHASTNLRAWEVSTINAKVENSIENASLLWNNPQQLAVQREIGRQSILRSAQMEGLSPEATNEKLQTYESSVAMAAINAAMITSSSAGESLFKQYKNRLEGPDLVKVKGEIQRKRKAEASQASAQAVFDQAATLVNQYGEEDDARSRIIDEINKIKDTKARKKVLGESMYQLDLKMRAKSEERGAVFEDAESFLAEGQSIEQYIASKPEQWEKLSSKQQMSLRSGESISTDFGLLSDLLTQPEKELAKVNPADHFDKLSKGDRAKLITAVKSARKERGSSGADAQEGRSRITQTSDMVRQLFGDKRDWNSKESARVNQFYSLLDGEVEFREKQKGSPLTSQEYTDVLNGFARDAVTKRGLFKNWLDIWGLSDEETSLDEVLEEIPEDQVSVLTTYLRGNGIPVTTETLKKAYDQATK